MTHLKCTEHSKRVMVLPGSVVHRDGRKPIECTSTHLVTGGFLVSPSDVRVSPRVPRNQPEKRLLMEVFTGGHDHD